MTPFRALLSPVLAPVLAAALAAALLAGCGSDDEPEPQAVSKQEACTQAEEVTDAYQEALRDAGTAEDAKSVIEGAISGLGDIETDDAVGDRIDQLATAMTSLLEAVEAGTPPAQLRTEAQAVGTTATALARDCGRAGQ